MSIPYIFISMMVILYIRVVRFWKNSLVSLSEPWNLLKFSFATKKLISKRSCRVSGSGEAFKKRRALKNCLKLATLEPYTFEKFCINLDLDTSDKPRRHKMDVKWILKFLNWSAAWKFPTTKLKSSMGIRFLKILMKFPILI